MGSILIALPKIEDAKHISDLLKRRGLESIVCTSGAKVLSMVHELDSGVVICGRRLTDMHYTQLAEYLPEFFEMLLIASQNAIGGMYAGNSDTWNSISCIGIDGNCGNDAGAAGKAFKEAEICAEEKIGA